MNCVGEGEPMHNHEQRGWEEEALENCCGAVRRNIIPKSLTLFLTKKCDFPYFVIFQVKTGDKFSPPFSDQKGNIAIHIIYIPNGHSYNIIGITIGAISQPPQEAFPVEVQRESQSGLSSQFSRQNRQLMRYLKHSMISGPTQGEAPAPPPNLKNKTKQNKTKEIHIFK